MTAIEKDLKNKKKEMKLKEQKALEFYHFLKEHDCILLETVVGSQAHGTSTPESDVDRAFIYILPQDYIYGTKYEEQLRIHKDYTGFEIKRFLELAQTNNPTVLELLYSPEDCIITKHPVFLQVFGQIRDKILTKRCKDSFAGYARKQIQKARGLDKMQNWEKERVVRKEPIDFCYVIDETGYGTKTLKWFLDDNSMEQKFCGISKIPNARDLYALFYDQKAHYCFSKLEEPETNKEKKEYYKGRGETVGIGYKGISKTDIGDSVSESNQLRLSSIPKGERVRATLIYNKDAYTSSCKDYQSYQTWLENRNEQRYVDNKEHGQSYDGKNLMHCKRLLQIAREIAEKGTVQIRRSNSEELLDIRKGKVNLEELLDWAENEMKEIDVLFDNSDLPNEVDPELINKVLIQVRKDFYTQAWKGWSGWTEGAQTRGAEKFVERYKDLSEFQTMVRNSILERNPDFRHDAIVTHPEHGDSSVCVEDYSNDEYGERFRLVDYVPTKNWVQCDGEDLDTENFYIYGLTDDKLTVGGGGDWQKGCVFDIVEHEDDFMCINSYTPEGEWPDRMSDIEFLRKLYIEVKLHVEDEE